MAERTLSIWRVIDYEHRRSVIEIIEKSVKKVSRRDRDKRE